MDPRPEILSFPENNITFHFEEINFQFRHSTILSSWVKSIILSENRILGAINFIFCSDEYLFELNVKYLNHHTFTDVITFSYDDHLIEGDVFISIERVKENATKYKITFENELHRVMVHGVLHLLGFDDKTLQKKEIMTENENNYLSILNDLLKNSD